MKRCGKCCVEKDENEFHKSKRRPDGLGNRCKQCKSIEHKEYLLKYPEKARKKHSVNLPIWRENNKGKCKEYTKKYSSKHYATKRKKTLEEINFLKEMAIKSQIEWKSLSEERKKEWEKEYRTREDVKAKDKARSTLENALLGEQIRRPNKCEICNVECKPEGHHFDYSKPLFVQWVCNKCHNQIHGKLKD